MNYKIEKWLQESQISDIEFSDYWNNESVERNKHWWVEDRNYNKVEEYIKSGPLLWFYDSLEQAKSMGFELSGKGIDIAAGTLWLEPYILESGNIQHLYCLEYSVHRLLKLGVLTLEHYNVPPEVITLCLGSFYDIKLPDNSLDFIVMSQAFHHANKPLDLLSETKRILKINGFVLLVGENEVQNSKNYEKNQHEIDGGDCYYSREEYDAIFQEAGFSLHTRGQNIGSGAVLLPCQ